MRWLLPIIAMLMAKALFQPQQALATTTLTFIPTADTYVDEAFPTKAYGSATSLAVDSDSVKQIFLRFQISDLSNVEITGVRLRMYSTNGSSSGGRIWTMSEQNWNEATTWNTRPVINGQQLGAFGIVAKGRWYDSPLPSSIIKSGSLSLAVDSTSTDRASWGSREVRITPRLLVDVETASKSNTAPAPENDSYVVTVNTPLTVAAPGVLGNDTDADGDPLTAVLVRGPTQGMLSFSATGAFTYTPNNRFIGSDNFTYLASDRTADSGVATVTFTVARVGVDTFEFAPEIDTYVNSSNPDKSFATSAGLWVDNSPRRIAFMKFAVDSVSGRKIAGVRLRLYQTNVSPVGEDVSLMDDTSWSEAITWNSRPTISGPLLASFGSVSNKNWYELPLGSAAVNGDGLVSFAIDSTHSDGAKWASREHTRIPRLLVDVHQIPGLVLNGLSRVAYNYVGASDPTYFSSQHRLALTSGGRQIAVHGRHAQGVQLAWRDPGSGWQTASHGALDDGLLLDSTGTGDWTASVIIADDPIGEEHAWVVYSGEKASSTFAVRMRRLSDLSNPAGPMVGPESIVSASGLGNSNADVSIETGPDGAVRRCLITWIERTTATSWDIKTARFDDLLAEIPSISVTETILPRLSGGTLGPTLVPISRGIGLVAANAANKLQLFRRNPPTGTWTPGPIATSTNGKYPSAVALSDDTVFAAVHSGTTVKLYRFSGTENNATTELTLSGFREPALATDGVRIWLVMVRDADGYLVSRERSANGTWGNVVVESAADGTDLSFRWPNTLRVVKDGYLRVIVEGPDLGTVRSAVLAYQRPW